MNWRKKIVYLIGFVLALACGVLTSPVRISANAPYQTITSNQDQNNNDSNGNGTDNDGDRRSGDIPDGDYGNRSGGYVPGSTGSSGSVDGGVTPGSTTTGATANSTASDGVGAGTATSNPQNIVGYGSNKHTPIARNTSKENRAQTSSQSAVRNTKNTATKFVNSGKNASSSEATTNTFPDESYRLKGSYAGNLQKNSFSVRRSRKHNTRVFDIHHHLKSVSNKVHLKSGDILVCYGGGSSSGSSTAFSGHNGIALSNGKILEMPGTKGHLVARHNARIVSKKFFFKKHADKKGLKTVVYRVRHRKYGKEAANYAYHHMYT